MLENMENENSRLVLQANAKFHENQVTEFWP